MVEEEFTKIAEDFDIKNIKDIKPFGSGHINDTLKVTTNDGYVYVMQRINVDVFKDPDGLMENTKNVTDHIRSKGHTSLKILDYKKP